MWPRWAFYKRKIEWKRGLSKTRFQKLVFSSYNNFPVSGYGAYKNPWLPHGPGPLCLPPPRLLEAGSELPTWLLRGTVSNQFSLYRLLVWATFWHFDKKSDLHYHFFRRNVKMWPKWALYKRKIEWKRGLSKTRFQKLVFSSYNFPVSGYRAYKNPRPDLRLYPDTGKL